MKRVGIFGFGKTGMAVARTVLQSNDYVLQWVVRRTHTLESRSVSEFLGFELTDNGRIYSLESVCLQDLCETHPVDYIFDFSSEHGLYEYEEVAVKNNIKVVSAISHYADREIEVLKRMANKTVVFWSPNITLGVNFLIYAAKFLQRIAPWCDIKIVEEHFKGKEGVSGTAKKIAEGLCVEENSINSVRAGGIVGKHEVIFGFPYQTVRLIHESISREAFGNGVLFVAEHIKKANRGFICFEDILKPYFVTI